MTYNQTYLQKALSALHDIYAKNGVVDIRAYESLRKKENDKSLLRFDTIVSRFFGGDTALLEQAARHYNHKIISVEKLCTRIDVYDLEVPETHNFALEAGIFVHNSSKQGRDRETQAILPLRGKILNVERARLDKMLANNELKSLIIALGTNIGEQFDATKLRYHKIVLMADADSVTADTPILVHDKKNDMFRLLDIGTFVDTCEDPKRYNIAASNIKSGAIEQRALVDIVKHRRRTPIYEITTRYGFSVKVTAWHSVYVSTKQGIQEKRGDTISPGDELVFAKTLPNPQRDIQLDLRPSLEKYSRDLAVALENVPIADLPDDAWVDLSNNSWRRLQHIREACGISRFAMAERIGVYKTIIQQWETRIDNVLPRARYFRSYLSEIGVQSPQTIGAFVPYARYQASRTVEPEVYYRNHTARVPTHLSLEESCAYLLGWYLGDGCFSPTKGSPNRFILSLGTEKHIYASHLTKALLLVLNASTIPAKNAKCQELHFHSFTFRLLLESLGLLGKRAHEKFVPDEIFNARTTIKHAFLRGLLESDGSVVISRPPKEGGKICLNHTTVSRRLADGIVTLYRQLGIFPAITQRPPSTHTSRGITYRGNFNRYDVIVGTREQLRALEPVWKHHKNAHVLAILLDNDDRRWGLGKRAVHPLSTDLVSIPVMRVRRLTSTDEFVYDLTVERYPNFFAGSSGILLHNTDGAHIRTLLLTLFWRYFRQLIMDGHIYIAQPPLYKLTWGQNVRYAYTDAERDRVVEEMKRESKKESPAITIQRFKGLGEMNPEQLWETTMNPSTRTMKQVTVEDAEKAEELFNILMGADVAPRKHFITTHAKAVKNLDI